MDDFRSLTKQVEINEKLKTNIEKILSENPDLPVEALCKGIIFNATKTLFSKCPDLLSAYRHVFKTLESVEGVYKYDNQFKSAHTKVKIMQKYAKPRGVTKLTSFTSLPTQSVFTA